MTLRAALFDVGDTLLEHWAPRERVRDLAMRVLRREFGERDWYERFLAAEIAPNARAIAWNETREAAAAEALQQETLRWYEEWFRGARIGIDDIDLDRLRVAATVPLDLVSELVPGAPEALRWCKESGLRVVLVTNTLTRGDDEVWEDWRRFGVADAIDAVVSSHSTGWQKPHRRMFERALELAAAAADEAVMVGDRLDADVLGASRLGMRTVLRRTAHPQPDIDVRPDAAVDDLTELPAILAPWLGGTAARRAGP